MHSLTDIYLLYMFQVVVLRQNEDAKSYIIHSVLIELIYPVGTDNTSVKSEHNLVKFKVYNIDKVIKDTIKSCLNWVAIPGVDPFRKYETLGICVNVKPMNVFLNYDYA